MGRTMSAVPKELVILRGDTFVDVLQLSAAQKSALPGRTSAWFTLKNSFADGDSDALLQVTEVGGLVILGGSSNVNPNWASLVVDENLGTITLTIEADATQLLASYNSHVFYDHQVRGSQVITLSRGRCYITRDATRSI